MDIFSREWWGENQDFMQIRLLHAHNLIGCGEKLQPITVVIKGAKRVHKEHVGGAYVVSKGS